MLSRLILCLVLLLSSAFAQLELIKNVRVGARPHGLYVEGEDIYVSLPEEDSIAVVNNYMVGTNVTLIPIGGCGPVDMVRNPGGEGEGEGEGEREGAGNGVRKASLFFISCTNKDSILSIDLSSGQTLGSWIVGSEPSLFANRVVSGVAYIPTVSSNLLTGFDLASSSFTRSYRTGDGPQVAEVARLGRMAYVSNNLAHTVSMINLVDGLATVVGLPSGSSPQGVGLDETEDVLVVAGSGLDQVYLLNLTSASIQQTIESVGPTPYSVAISPSGKYAFVTNFGSNTISIIDVLNSKVVDQITSGQQPILARVFSSRLFVSNFASGTISIFDIVE